MKRRLRRRDGGRGPDVAEDEWEECCGGRWRSGRVGGGDGWEGCSADGGVRSLGSGTAGGRGGEGCSRLCDGCDWGIRRGEVRYCCDDVIMKSWTGVRDG